MKVEFYRHSIGAEEIDNFKEVFDSVFLTTGPKCKEFERTFAEYLGVKHCVTVSSCTMAMFLSLKALGISEGDEVIVPTMSFIATANVVEYCGAKPVFVDSDSSTGCLSVESIADLITDKTKAIIPVHLYGVMIDIKALRKIVPEDIAIIEDSAHCAEGSFDSERPGVSSDAACFSFYATKNLTCGEGGAIATNRDDIAEKLLILRQMGMNKSSAIRYGSQFSIWDMTCLGYKANLSDINAAILIPQLPKLEQRLGSRQKLASRYHQGFADLGLNFPSIPEKCQSALHLTTVWIPNGKRNAIAHYLNRNGIGVAINFPPIHLTSYYQKKYKFKLNSFPVAERIGNETLSLPFYPGLSEEKIDWVLDKLRSAMEDHNDN